MSIYPTNGFSVSSSGNRFRHYIDCSLKMSAATRLDGAFSFSHMPSDANVRVYNPNVNFMMVFSSTIELISSRNIHSLYYRSAKTQVDYCILETNEFLVFIILE
jgi:hypothetical protein